MEKNELIEALRETGVLAKNNDANGIRILLTLNDFEEIKSKIQKSKRESNLQAIQFWGILTTAICLIVSTIWGIFSSNNNVTFIPRSAYVLKISGNGEDVCFIPEVNAEYAINTIKKQTGLSACK